MRFIKLFLFLIIEFGHSFLTWERDRNVTFFSLLNNDLKDLLDDAIDIHEKEAKYNDPKKVSSIEFNSAFNESYDFLDNLSGESTDS